MDVQITNVPITGSRRGGGGETRAPRKRTRPDAEDEPGGGGGESLADRAVSEKRTEAELDANVLHK